MPMAAITAPPEGISKAYSLRLATLEGILGGAQLEQGGNSLPIRPVFILQNTALFLLTIDIL